MVYAELIERAAQLVAGAERITCLTGAGVSAESGVATFRDAQAGLWANVDPQQLASQAGFAADPALVWRWYMERLAGVQTARPNAGHVALAGISATVSEFTLVTQNVDDLHERGGSSDVIHLHGSIARFRCNQCHGEHTLHHAEESAHAPPVCRRCGCLVRPDVVWFGEMLPQPSLERAWDAAKRCDVMLVVGTSGVVYPAAQLPAIAREAGAKVIDINPEASTISRAADIHLAGASGTVLPQLLTAIRKAI